MDEKVNKPSIRFTGFTDAWEQRKLGELGQTYSGLSGKIKEDFGHGEASFITYMNVFTNPISDTQMVEPIEVDVSQNEVSVGDVFFTTSSETPEEVGMSSVLLAKQGKTYLNSFCFGYRLAKKVELHYLAYMLRSYSVRKRITFLAQGISRYNISKNKVMEIEVPFPSFQEQELLGIYFRDFDSFIALHQRKYDKLVKLKKSMLEKMFPQHGADVPEVRFSGFTDSWERRKLGEIVEFNPKSKIPDVFEYVDLESVEGTRMVSHREEYRISAPSRAQRVARKGDLFYQTVRPYQKNNYLFENADKNYVFSTGYAQIRSKMDGYFLLSLVQTEPFLEAVLDRCTGTSYPAINANDLAEMEIRFPILEDEQNKVSVFFRNLDTIITLHQRKLTKLQNIKKSCLEKMFV